MSKNMKFRTEIDLPPSKFNITYQDPVLLIGSCFTENVGRKLDELLFQTDINPFGVVYNPLSVKRSMDILISGKPFEESDLDLFNEKWFSWDHHSSFSGKDRETVLKNINRKITDSNKFLKNTGYLFISFGTAWVYRLKKTGNIVCNCHKVPAKEFDRELLKVKNITNAYFELIETLKDLNPRLKIIFTVSPVRHWKDGAHGNQLSKSILHLAIDEIIIQFKDSCEYFPSYEILLDDLRDYRFYADDLLHPNEMGIEYIWEKFIRAYFKDETLGNMKKVEDLVKASKHKLSVPDSESSRKFLFQQKQKMNLLKKELPFLNWQRLSGLFEIRE